VSLTCGFGLNKSDGIAYLTAGRVVCQIDAGATTILWDVNRFELAELPLVKLTALAACQRPREDRRGKRLGRTHFQCFAMAIGIAPRLATVGSDSSQTAAIVVKLALELWVDWKDPGIE